VAIVVPQQAAYSAFQLARGWGKKWVRRLPLICQSRDGVLHRFYFSCMYNLRQKHTSSNAIMQQLPTSRSCTLVKLNSITYFYVISWVHVIKRSHKSLTSKLNPTREAASTNAEETEMLHGIKSTGLYNSNQLRGVWMQGLKFSWCHIGCYIGCRMECSDTNKKNKLQIPSVSRETNLLSPINPLLAYSIKSWTD
jgi:hypothetical protein